MTKKEYQKIIDYIFQHHQHFDADNKIIKFIKNIFKWGDNWNFKDGFPYVESLELEKFINNLYKK